MTQIKRLFALLIIAATACIAKAQTNGCNSSYSRFGLGTLCEQSLGQNRGMAGVAQGLRNPIQVNMQNPASYSCIDTLTFIFDAGMTMQTGRLSGNKTSINVMNAMLDYVSTGFRLRRGMGMSVGFVPYSNIGYNFNESHIVGSSYTTGQTITSKTTYYGNGGLHQIYMGVGWNPVAGLSIGANIGYLWGSYSNSLAQQFFEGSSTTSNVNYNTQNEEWSSDIRTYKMDIGVQYPIQIDKENELTVGATVGIGHRIGSNVTLLRYTSQGDTIERKADKAFELPYTISGGLTWKRKERLTVGADYAIQLWKGCRLPVSQSTATNTDIVVSTDQYQNMHRATVGADYIHNPYGKYIERMHFRLGASYTTPYAKVNGRKGPSELRLTAGTALPLKTGSLSLINVSAEWLLRNPSVSNQIRENYFMLHVGISVNETWFMKRRFQ